MIEIKSLCKTYEARSGVHHALRDVNLTINDGDIFGIIGASGAGKSTLVRCINLLERPTSGSIVIDGNDVTGYDGRQLFDLRAGIGMIFQNFSLFQQRTVLQNVTFPLELRKGADGAKGSAAKAAREARARELLDVVGLADKADRYPSELSGGQQQRVAIARALANNPKIMLCDEATSALDTRTTVSILSLLKEINAKLGVTMVVITHSLTVAEKICNRIAVIDEGIIVEEGLTADVFANPQSPVTRELIENDSLSAVSSSSADERVSDGKRAGADVFAAAIAGAVVPPICMDAAAGARKEAR
ncbi:MAG: ATP-binding cassette domain-containing protein [Eggerthellaceae bacterium]|nr:ATP-binding cassette domain-containing protein [Eggerthellaceae bacterium]